MENCDEEDCPEDEVDPRVKDELDALNAASVEINKLETEIDKARTKFRMLLSEATSRLNVLHKKLGKAVDKARPYYVQLKQTKKTEVDLQAATVSFQRANSLYRAARETVELAEQRMAEKSAEDDRPEFDTAWQEMMNHATMKFMTAEQDRTQTEQTHGRCVAEFSQAQRNLQYFQKDIPRSINKAKPYFELKDHLEIRLQQERQSVEDLQRALTAAKGIYRSALGNLETISEEIHASRQLRQEPLPPRTPGVGAEAGALVGGTFSDSLSINLDAESMKSGVMLDDADVASLCSQDVSFVRDVTEKFSHPLASNLVEATVVQKTMSANQNRPAEQLETKQQNHPENSQSCQQGATNAASEPTDFTAQGAIPKNYKKSVSSKTSVDSQRICSNGSANPEIESHVTGSESENGDQCESAQLVSKSSLETSSNIAAAPNVSTDSTHQSQRSRPKDKRVEKLHSSQFPMLLGLMESNKKLSPKLPEGRPKGKDIMSRHSPSPVRKNEDGYFEFPVHADSCSDNGIARELQDAEGLFTNSQPPCASQDKTVSNVTNNPSQSQAGTSPQSQENPINVKETEDRRESLIVEQPDSSKMQHNPQTDQRTCENSEITTLSRVMNDVDIDEEKVCEMIENDNCDKPEVIRGEGEGRESEETVSCVAAEAISGSSENEREEKDLASRYPQDNILKSHTASGYPEENSVESDTELESQCQEENLTNNNNTALGDVDSELAVYLV